ncbi:MAG: MFS transporter [Oscillospiraceae bacterium]|nr:MFS transporter [Oscillospiraceae bacterium]
MLLIIIYLAFISLGLPDSLLGAAWPVMHRELAAPLPWSGIVFMIISAGTVVSSLLSDRLNRRFGTGRVTACSVALTCAALFGFSLSGSFWQLCLWAVPYGLGAGGVDAALNNYVALHYASRHMSWLHCMWGVGATVGPYVMGAALAAGSGWQTGYRVIGCIQLVLTAMLLLSLRLWKQNAAESRNQAGEKALSLASILAIPGAKAVMLAFFCYCALEQTVGLWASSYLVNVRGVEPVTAARYGSLFFLGVTGGRAISGFVTYRLNDTQMVRLGQWIIAAGAALLILPLGEPIALVGLVLIGLGCAPIYPCIIHSTPSHFGAARSQALIGVQMASAYVGTSLMPPLFGALAARSSLAIFPLYLLVLLAVMAASHAALCRKTNP